MPTIAELQIKVDSSPVEQATKSLNEFAVAADKAGKATKQKQQSDDQAAAASEKVSRSSEKSAAAVSKQAKELESLIGKIDPVTKKLNDLAKQEAILFANKGNLPAAAFEQYNKVLEESFNKLLGVSTAQKQVSSSTEGVPERLIRIGQAAVEAANGQQSLTSALRGASEAEQGLVSSGAVEASRRRAEAALEEFNARRQATQASRDATAALKGEAQSLTELSGKIDPTLRKLDELRALREQLNKANANGAFANNPEEFTRLTQVLDRNTEAYKRQNAQLANTGKTAKEVAFAMRGLPAQFTDIVVSLQGGQAPLTVLLQQGGQIKDMFGGIVPALRAMAQGLMAMVTPATVGAAALLALGVAAYSGSQELTAFNRAIILSNNAAGVSASQFAQYRDTLDSTVTTSGKAAEALTLIAAGGRVLNEQFVAVAESAILFEKATGQALSETINDFNAIGKEPVEAAIRLDEKYKFLTASVLAQADALVRMGNDTEAASLLQDTLATATSEAATKVIEQAGYMEKAWNGVKGAITGTWDALKQIGRESTAADELKILNDQLEALESRQKNNTKLFGGLGGSGIQKEIDDQKALIKQKQLRLDYEKLLAKQAADAEDVRRDAVSAQASSLKRQENNLKGVEKAENDLRKVRLENSKIEAGGNVSDESRKVMIENEARAVKALADAKEAEAKKGRKSSPLDTREVQTVKNSLAELNAEYDGYYKRVTTLGTSGVVSAEATFASQKAILEAQKKAVSESYDAQISAIKSLQANKKNSASQSISLDNQLSKAESDRAVALEKIDAKQDALAAKEQGRIDKRTASISAYKAALDAQVSNLQDEGARAADGVGRGDQAAALAKQLNENDRAFAKQQRTLAKSFGEGNIDVTEYRENLQNLQDTHTAMTEQLLKNNEDIRASNEDWTNGFTRAIENAAEESRNFASMTNQAVSGAFNSMGDALGNFVTTGKLDFKSLASSIISDMAKIAAKAATNAALSSLFQIGASYFTGGVSSGLGPATMSGSSEYGQITTVQEKGGAWSGGTQFFANGGAFTNSIVSSPTSFAMNGGKKGVMGEAGPEAILPLARTSDGSLGVRFVGSADQSQSSSGVVVYVSVTSDGTTSETNDSNYTGFGKELGDFVDSRIRTLQAKSLSAGGDLRRAIDEK